MLYRPALHARLLRHPCPLQALEAAPGDKYSSRGQQPGWLFQTSVLTVRTFLNNLRNVGVFWMRLAMVRARAQGWRSGCCC